MQNAITKLRQSLQRYEAREAQSIIDLLLEEVCGITRVFRIMNPQHVLSDEQKNRLDDCAEKLSQGIPVQQVLGYEWFCGQRFKVTPHVLIPRPETAELVQWICEENKGPVDILDIGTGTGCIALSLARLINNSQVLAIDLSTEALNVARENSCQQGIDNVYFAHCDILKSVDNSYFETQINRQLTTYQPHSFDIVVSNPPYICQQEAKEMSTLVLEHEPGLALFVPDSDPLLFYRAIAQFSLEHLRAGGKLYFEINAAYGVETCDLLRRMGYQEVTLRQDINGRDRMVSCKKG